MTKKLQCPRCGKAYGINTRKDESIRCKLCGYEGPAMTPEKTVRDEPTLSTSGKRSP